jgi:hypothetical protein
MGGGNAAKLREKKPKKEKETRKYYTRFEKHIVCKDRFFLKQAKIDYMHTISAIVTFTILFLQTVCCVFFARAGFVG